MKKLTFIVFYLLFALGTYSQSEYTTYSIRNYQKSLTLTIKEHQASKVVLDAYGKTLSITNPINVDLSYSFNGQEKDGDLNLYFYPRRMYSARTLRFLQVDPMSQYFSPYAFVGGDPVNYIDYSGNAGKPIILHNWNHTRPGSVEYSLPDIKAQAGDAYYVPLTDVANGTVQAEFPEFNGNIYIDSHMGMDAGVELERDNSTIKFKTHAKYRKIDMEDEKPHFRVGMKGRDLGRELRNLAEAKNLEVKNIVAGGCQGAESAKAIGQGFTERPSGAVTRKELTTIGLREGYDAVPVGDRMIAAEGLKGVGETRFYATPHGVETEYASVDGTTFTDKPEFETLKYHNDESIFAQEAKFAPGQEYTGLLQEARVPKSLDGVFETFEFKY